MNEVPQLSKEEQDSLRLWSASRFCYLHGPRLFELFQIPCIRERWAHTLGDTY